MANNFFSPEKHAAPSGAQNKPSAEPTTFVSAIISSSVTATQAFRYGTNAYGLLFHMEVTVSLVRAMVETFADELQAAGLNGVAIKLNAHTHLPALQQIGHGVFKEWAAMLR